VSLTILTLTFNRDKNGIDKSSYVVIWEKQHQLCCSN